MRYLIIKEDPWYALIDPMTLKNKKEQSGDTSLLLTRGIKIPVGEDLEKNTMKQSLKEMPH